LCGAVEAVRATVQPRPESILAVLPVDVDITHRSLSIRRDIADILAVEGQSHR